MPAAYSSDTPDNKCSPSQTDALDESRCERDIGSDNRLSNGVTTDSSGNTSTKTTSEASTENSSQPLGDGLSKISSQPSPTSSSASQKKKKKRKSVSNRELDGSQALPNESSIYGDGLEQWRARAINRRALLAQANADNERLRNDLSAAQARADDAEHAEAVVNRGLLTAKSVITQRDRALADLTNMHQQLKAEHVTVVEEKKRADKRLIILKTMSANLHEAREGKEVAERKLDEAGATNRRLSQKIEELVKENNKLVEGVEHVEKENAGLVAELHQTKVMSQTISKEVEGLKKKADSTLALKEKLLRAEIDYGELQDNREKLRVASRRNSICAAWLGAVGVFTLNLTVRMLRGGNK